MIKAAILGVAALAATVTAVPAAAVVQTFANYSAVSSARNFRWIGTTDDATFYTTSTANGSSAGSTNTNFSFTLGQLPLNIPAKFLMTGTVTNTIAVVNGQTLIQSNLTGTFSFLSRFAVDYAGGYAANSNLLSGSFTQTTLSGTRNGGTAGINGSTQGGSSITFTSDFLSIVPLSNLELSWSLSSISPLFNSTGLANSIIVTPNKSVRSFRAVIGGQFSSDPAPIPVPVPEPEVWALLVIGFGLVGVQVRRRARQSAVAA